MNNDQIEALAAAHYAHVKAACNSSVARGDNLDGALIAESDAAAKFYRVLYSMRSPAAAYQDALEGEGA